MSLSISRTSNPQYPKSLANSLIYPDPCKTLAFNAERDLRIEIDAPASHAFRGQREDLDEMLGNLLDNACKWARARVSLTCSKVGERIVIAVDDDGP